MTDCEVAGKGLLLASARCTAPRRRRSSPDFHLVKAAARGPGGIAAHRHHGDNVLRLDGSGDKTGARHVIFLAMSTQRAGPRGAHAGTSRMSRAAHASSSPRARNHDKKAGDPPEASACAARRGRERRPVRAQPRRSSPRVCAGVISIRGGLSASGEKPCAAVLLVGARDGVLRVGSFPATRRCCRAGRPVFVIAEQ